MSLTRKVKVFEKPNVGYVVFTELRLPFRVFSKDAYKVMFRPNFDGAKWYEIDLEKVDADVLLESKDAFSAMAYLRSVQEM